MTGRCKPEEITAKRHRVEVLPGVGKVSTPGSTDGQGDGADLLPVAR